jgi:hypothetical protein
VAAMWTSSSSGSCGKQRYGGGDQEIEQKCNLHRLAGEREEHR